MHWFTHGLIKTTFKPGFYKVLKNTKTLIQLDKVENAGNFPKWRDIIPDHKKYFIHHTETWPLIVADLGSLGIGVNTLFLEPLGLFYDKVKVYFGEPDRPIKIDVDTNDLCQGLHAVIMPVNYQKPTIETESD